MSNPITRSERLNRIQLQIDAVRDLCADLEIAAKFSRNPMDAFESEAYADFLDAVYDLTEIDAVYDMAQEIRHGLDRGEEISECRRNGAYLRADIIEGMAA